MRASNPNAPRPLEPGTLLADLKGGVVVFLIALPLSLGIALASGAGPAEGQLSLISGLIAGVVGGIIVGFISGSGTSVSGAAAGMAAIVLSQLAACGSVSAFLLAVVLAGLLQLVLGVARAGAFSLFVPTSVIKGLLAAIGVILILTQIPHLVGRDQAPEGIMSFGELWSMFSDYHIGALTIGLLSVAMLVFWERAEFLKRLSVPGPIVVVVFGVLLQLLFSQLGTTWSVTGDHLVQIPLAKSATEFVSFLTFPDFNAFSNPAVYTAALTIGLVASLETLLNLEAIDKIDPLRRYSPPNRELLAQGVGNVVSGMLGGLPVISVIVRSSVNVDVGAKTKVSTMIHGVLLLLSVTLLPTVLNLIPLSSLAAILIVTGCKIASPKLFRQMWSEGKYQFVPFLITFLAIVFSDILTGVLIGLGVSILFILNSNLRQPIRRVVESHLTGEITHIELSPQVSFLNRGALTRLFYDAKPDSHVLVDASHSDYIDPDVLSLIRDFKANIAPVRGVQVSLKGFRDRYEMRDELLFADYATRELKEQATPQQVLAMLADGNERFRSGRRLTRDLGRQVDATSKGQNPFAAILSCIDSRVPTELVFDQGIGDTFGVRVAGNVVGTKTLASLEYAVAVSGVKLVLVLGHTRCGAVTASVDFLASGLDVEKETGCGHLNSIVQEVAACVTDDECRQASRLPDDEKARFVDQVAKRNVVHTVEEILEQSNAIRKACERGDVQVLGALYDVATGKIEFIEV